MNMPIKKLSAKVNFRVDPDVKTRAEAICKSIEMDLVQVMRILLRRIATEEAIPFDLNAPARAPTPARVPFDRYGTFLEHDLKHLKAESVISLLAGFVAKRARQMATERAKSRPNTKKIEQWNTEAMEAMTLRRSIDTNDEALLARTEKRFTALLVAD